MGRASAPTDLPPLMPIDISGLPTPVLRDWLSTMTLVREFELACDPLAKAAKIPGGIHSAVGQEAVAVGSIRAIVSGDFVCGTHRTHHHALSTGMSPRAAMAELLGRATGCAGGRGGSMHLCDIALGYVGGNGIVGAGVGLAMGIALAAKLRGTSQVAVGFVGDGGVNTGRTWESVNLAAIWQLPLVVVCENNLYAVETATGQMTGGESIVARASGFGAAAVSVDGQDVAAMYRVTLAACDRARRGDGPTFIEAQTYRYEGHSTGQVVTYRSPIEVEEWRRSRDPIERLRRAMEASGLLAPGEYESMLASARSAVEDAVAFAESSPWPDAEGATADVTGLPTLATSHA